MERLSEVLKRKKTFERPLLEQRLYDNIIGVSEETTHSILSDGTHVFRDYVNESTKRRAQTISVAYNIATKILLSLELTNSTKTFIESTPYHKDEVLLNKLRTEDFDNFVYDTMIKAIDRVKNELNEDWKEHKANIYFLDKLSSVAVTLAWLEVYYKTTFMPKDIQIVATDSETHKALAYEVFHISYRTLPTLKKNLDFLDKSFVEKLEFDKYVSDVDNLFSGTANIVINNTILLEIKTTSSLPADPIIQKDFQHAIGINQLNKDIHELYIYYTRFDFVVAVDIHG